MTDMEALIRVAERTIENRRQMKNSTQQRRTSFVDLYGIEYLRQGDANNPATFYISVSPDFAYYERFAFKFQIMPYVSPVLGGTGSAIVDVEETSLTGGSTITPNPHDHTTKPHTHNLIKGLSFANTTSTNWRVKIHDVDITYYLIEQQDGAWIDGEGIYPNNGTDDKEDFYDILDVACLLNEQGETEKVNKLLTPEFKKVEIISDAPFQVAAMLYLKYNHVNR